MKVLLENFLSLSLLQVVGYILPLLTLPYIAKVIGVAYFGEIAFASAVIVFFQTLVDYGYNYTGVRDISRIRENKEEVSKVYSTIFFSKLILMVLGFIILVLLIFMIPEFERNRKILLFTFSIIPGYILYPEWLFQGLEKMKYSAILSTIIKLIFTLLIFIVVKSGNDYVYIPLINGAGFLIVGILAFFFIKRLGYSLVRVSVKEIIISLKGSTDMFISLILPNLYTNMSTIFLGNYWGRVSTGIFDAGNKFIGLSQQFTNVLSRAFYPYLARKLEKHSIFERISLILSLIISVGLYFLAPLIVSVFYNNDFVDAVIVIRIMSISPIFIFMMNAYGTNYLVLKGREHVLRNIVLVCSILGLGLSWILVKKYSFIGAAIAITSIWALRGLLTMYYAKRKI
ncbi:flippase [Myroides phaeus]|uniref:flippase n=1 Tax=Myroides phaeus TaxID=702745 RepID=UPI0015A2D682|nr:flippase [Myroides phaeus]